MANIYIEKLVSLNLLDKKGEALDLGCGKGFFSKDLLELGYKVTAIDRLDTSIEGVNFIKSNIQDYLIEKNKYSVIICNNVLPFISDKSIVKRIIGDMVDGLVEDGVLFFSVFGEHDAWKDDLKMSFFSYDEISDLVKTLNIQMFEKSSTEGYGKTMKGDMKYWHIFRFVLTNNLPK